MKASKNLFKTLIVLVLGLSIGSCKKNNITYTFKGKVNESINSSGLADASVKVSQVIFSSNAANANFQLAGETTTDASGNYEVIIDREKVIEFKVTFNKDGYFKHDEEFSAQDVTTDEINYIDYTLDTESWVVFDIENVTPMVDDQLTMVKFNFREGCLGCGANEYTYLEGAIDTIITYKTTGGQYARFSYKDESTSLTTFDSVLTVPFDTVHYSIVY